MNRKILFCNITYMQYYDSGFEKEIPQNGGAYIAEHKTGMDINNFHRYSDDRYYGFVEPGILHNKARQVHIENIDSAYREKNDISDVTVIFCATSAEGPVIVGWYPKATVFRSVQKKDNNKDILYNIRSDGDTAVLLRKADRKMKVPRANSDGYGFGESQFWYANQDDERIRSYVDKIWKYIDAFKGENNLLPLSEHSEESV